METFAAYFWMIASFINMSIIMFIGYRTKKIYHLLYVIMWLCCGLWGMTVPSINIPLIRDLNSIYLPIMAGASGMWGGLLRMAELIKQKINP